METERWWGLGVMLLSVALLVFVGKVLGAVCGVAGIGVIVWAEIHKRRTRVVADTEGWFALEVPAQVHRYIPFEMFVRNCGPRSIRRIRFAPLKSRGGLNLLFNDIASLAKDEKVRVGFRVRAEETETEYPGISAHVVSVFEEGSQLTDQPPYPLLIHFLDGNKERTERHIIEGHPLPRGGVSLATSPTIQDESPSSRPLLRGEITEGRISTFGRGQVPWVTIFFKLRITNEHQGMATIKNASLQLAIGKQKYHGKLERTATRIADDPGPDLLTMTIQSGIGTVGWVYFLVTGLEMMNSLSGTQADATVILVDEFDVSHEIHGRGIRLR